MIFPKDNKHDYEELPDYLKQGIDVHFVKTYDEVFHIAVQEIATGNMRILTQTTQDESPSIAPNGATLLYATKERGKGILGAVSLDAGVKNKWPARRGDVREPAWSPYFE